MLIKQLEAVRARKRLAANPPPRQPWLAGVKIVDLANVIAGPTIGAVLARFGAEVTKVDPVTPSYAPDVTVLYGLAANVGKRSALVNVHDPEGRAVFEAMLARSDVLVANATAASLERLRCTPSELHAISRNLILCRFDAWGGPNEGCGVRDSHLGYDDNIQAALGIMERFGGGLGRVEEHAHIGTVDVIAGVGGALATVAALYYREVRRRRQPGVGGTIIARASLAALGQLVQYPFCCGSPAELAAEAQRATTTLGPLCRGEHALLRCYQAADGAWLLLHASLHPWQREEGDDALGVRASLDKLATTHTAMRDAIGTFREALPHAVNADAPPRAADDALAAALASAFHDGGLSAAAWVALLRTHAVPAVELCSLSTLRTRHARAALDLHGPTFQFLTDAAHPAGTPLTYFAPLAIRPASTPLAVPLAAAPRYGAHTRELLRELGFDPTPLLASGVASDGWCASYLPGATHGPPTPATERLPASLERVHSCPIVAPKKIEHGSSPIALGLSPAEGLRTSAHLGAKTACAKEACPVCLEAITRRVELGCTHALCYNCATKCCDAGHRRCPVCRVPHLLHPSRLAERSAVWRKSYAQWRVGKAIGAHGELSTIRAPMPMEAARFAASVGHTPRGGDVHATSVTVGEARPKIK